MACTWAPQYQTTGKSGSNGTSGDSWLRYRAGRFGEPEVVRTGEDFI